MPDKWQLGKPVIDLDDLEYDDLIKIKPGDMLAVDATPHKVGATQGTISDGRLATFAFYSNTILEWVSIDANKTVTYTYV